jgi:hypothetical protein
MQEASEKNALLSNSYSQCNVFPEMHSWDYNKYNT